MGRYRYARDVGTLGNAVPFHDLPPGEWWDVFETYLLSTFLVTRTVLPSMRGQGCVGSSISRPRPAFSPIRSSHYDALKAALLNLTSNLAKTYAEDGILVNAVSPTRPGHR